MTPAFVLAHTIPAALSLLPPQMDTATARAMLLAIGLQESRFVHRRQVKGPARGYWQFEERGGVAGVLTHQNTMHDAWDVCDALGYKISSSPDGVYAAIADNDVLACCFARLLLWTLPDALSTTAEGGWDRYIRAWRPGKPHPETWAGHWETAWSLVEGK